MKNVINNIKSFFENSLAFWIVLSTIITCIAFLCIGVKSENGYITLDGKDAVISENITKAMESFEDAIYRVMNESTPTDEETVRNWSILNEATGQGSLTTLEQVISRKKPDYDNDGGRGWQCSKYTAYLATGIKDYSSAHPDYGPVNGKDVVRWLVETKGWKYIDKPVEGAIGSGGFNTQFGHTAMFLYWVSNNVAMVNDANFTPLTVNTHPMDVSGWIWAVPGDYTPTPTPQPISSQSYTVVRGDTLGEIALRMGWCNGCKLFGDDGYTQRLADHNNIPNRGLIYPGQVIWRK